MHNEDLNRNGNWIYNIVSEMTSINYSLYINSRIEMQQISIHFSLVEVPGIDREKGLTAYSGYETQKNSIL